MINSTSETPPRREAAVIEIGSTSIRMAIACREADGSLRHLDDLDLPAGLGRDSFTDESLSAVTTERCVAAIRKFQQVLSEHGMGAGDLRVVATSAVREARNQDAFTDRVLIATGLRVQVLNELTNVARRKMRLSWSETRALLSTLRDLLTVRSITVETHAVGLALAERYDFSTYDAMIVASAIEAGCDTLWSEDMQDGMALEEGVRIVNPFRVAF